MSKILLPRQGYVTEVHTDGTKLHSRSKQANYSAIMERNAELRKSKDAVKDLGWGRLALDVPVTDMKTINAMFPGAMDTTHPDHKAALRRFIASPAADPYRVSDDRIKRNAFN